MRISDNSSGTVIQGVLEKKNILEFVETELSITLYPVQIFLLKVFYSIPLTSNVEENKIELCDKFNENILHIFSEVEFLEFLYTKGFINISEIHEERVLTEVIFVIGRRGTKSVLTNLITAYSLYLCLLHDSPHDYYGILKEDEIGVALVSNTLTGAQRQYRTLTRLVYGSPFFKRHLSSAPAIGQFYLKSSSLLEGGESAKHFDKGDFLISTFAANSSARGSSNIVTVLDEFAHYLDSAISTKENPLDKVMYDVLAPSSAGFITPEGVPEGKNFYISSPNGMRGMLYDMFQGSMASTEERTSSLAVQLPSYWVNPKLSSQVLRSIHARSSNSYDQEMSSKFIEKTGTWLIDIESKVYNAVNRDKGVHLSTGESHLTYYQGVDFGMSGDGTSVAVAHYVPHSVEYTPLKGVWTPADDVIIVDYIGYLKPRKESPLTIDEIISLLRDVDAHYLIESGMYDQWSGEILRQLLEKHDFLRLKKVPSTQQTNSDQAKLFRQLLVEGRIQFPNHPDFITELFRLTESTFRNGLIKVEDKKFHDDMFDAVTRAVWLAFNAKDSSRDSYNSLQRAGSPQGGRDTGRIINKNTVIEGSRRNTRVSRSARR